MTNEFRTFHPATVRVPPCFECRALHCCAGPLNRIRNLHLAQRPRVCRPPFGGPPLPLRYHCAFSNFEAPLERCEKHIGPCLDLHASSRITGLTVNRQCPKTSAATCRVTERGKPTKRRVRPVTRRPITNLGRAFKPMTPVKTARPLACERHRIPRSLLFIVQEPIES
jgi:hypothetical protein